MRGRLWWNTAEDRWETRAEREAVDDTSVEGAIKRLAQADKPDDRCAAAKELVKFGQDATWAIPILMECAVNVDAKVRDTALATLEAIDPAWPENKEALKGVPILIEALKSMFSDVSRAAFRLLRLIGPRAVPYLGEALLDGEDTSDRIHAIRVLGLIGPSAAPAVPGLIRALSSQFLHIRIAAAQALARIGSPPESAIPALVAGLSDRSSDARTAMATCLALLGEAAEPAVPALLPLLADRNKKVRESAAAALEQVGPRSVPALIQLVEAREAQRLKAWAETVAEVSGWFPLSEPDLSMAEPIKVWRNLSWAAYDILDERARLEEAQRVALRVLGKLDESAVDTFSVMGAAAVPSLIDTLAPGNRVTQENAAKALGRIGADAQAAIPALARALQESHPWVQEQAARALAKIESHPGHTASS